MRDRLRPLCLSLLWFWLRLRGRGLPALPPGPILVIAPHPDDAALGCGGLLLRWRSENREVHVVCLTDGAASHPGDPDWSGDKLRMTRREEEKNSARALGIPAEHLHFFDWPDGKLSQKLEKESMASASRIAELAGKLSPVAVFVTGRDEPSDEHRAAHTLTLTALSRSGRPVPLVEYLVWARWSPPSLLRAILHCDHWFFLEVPASDRAARRAAIAAHASQLQAPSLPGGFFRVFDRPEEAFFVYAPPP
jgi:N-acetylglucosamine malate deacetylase 1